MRNTRYILLAGVVGMGMALSAQGQMQPLIPGQNSSTSRLGTATLNDVVKPSMAPIGVSQIGQAASSVTARQPGSNLGLIDGSVGKASLSGNAGFGSSLGTPISGQSNMGMGIGSGNMSMPTGMSFSSGGMPGGLELPKGSAWTPSGNTLGTSGLTGTSSGVGTGATGSSLGTGGAKFGTGGSGFSAPENAVAEPTLAKGLKPGEVGATSQPAVMVAAPVSRDELWTKACEAFNRGSYRECQKMVEKTATGSQAPLDLRLIFIASLVAQNRESMAAFEAVQAAKVYPKSFLNDQALVDLYKDNPDFRKHFATVEKIGKSATATEPGLLWALYQRVEGSEGNNPRLTLKLLVPKGSEEGWFKVLQEHTK